MSIDKEASEFAMGTALVKPYLHLEGQVPLPLGDGKLREGIALLESIVTDDFWEAHWFLGKSFEATGEFDKSARHFEIAFSIESGRTSVAHEFLISLLRVKSFQKAKDSVCRLSSLNDPCLRFDSAMIYYASGDFNDALELLKRFDWPHQYQERVSSLLGRMRDRH